MAVQKYRKFYKIMCEQNKTLFDEFQPVHDGYVLDPDTWEDRFHTLGRDVVDEMRSWERRLCSGMERGVNAQYSNRVSEKFWDEIKKRFSHIELVGVRKTKTS